jgi:phage terminase small subunit
VPAARTRKNDAKLEAFAAELAKGRSATEAARLSGYGGSSLISNAKRRAQLPSVRARVVELREIAARHTVVTIERLVDNAEEARLMAMSLEEPSAANQLIQTIAKLSGLWRDKAEISGPAGGPIEVASDADRARALVALLARHQAA